MVPKSVSMDAVEGCCADAMAETLPRLPLGRQGEMNLSAGCATARVSTR